MSDANNNKQLSEEEQKEYELLKKKYGDQFQKIREGKSPYEDYSFLKQENEVAKHKAQACHEGAEVAQSTLESIKYNLGLEPPSQFSINRAREIGCFLGEMKSAAGIRHEDTPEKLEKGAKELGEEWRQKGNSLIDEFNDKKLEKKCAEDAMNNLHECLPYIQRNYGNQR